MKKRGKVILWIVVVVILVAAFAVSRVISSMETNLEQLVTTGVQDVDLSIIPDGIYNGDYGAFPISVQVTVTVKSHKITHIALVKHSNGQGAPAEAVLERVIEAQSLQVDTISGATYSSVVILKAIEDALK